MTQPALTAQQAIEALAFFRSLDAGARAQLARSARVLSYPANTVILRTGDAPEALHFLLRGRVAVQVQSARPDSPYSAMTDIIEPGDCYGLVGVLDGEPHPAAALALEDCLCLAVPREVFRSILEKSPGLAVELLHELARRLRHARTWVSRTL